MSVPAAKYSLRFPHAMPEKREHVPYVLGKKDAGIRASLAQDIGAHEELAPSCPRVIWHNDAFLSAPKLIEVFYYDSALYFFLCHRRFLSRRSPLVPYPPRGTRVSSGVAFAPLQFRDPKRFEVSKRRYPQFRSSYCAPVILAGAA